MVNIQSAIFDLLQDRLNNSIHKESLAYIGGYSYSGVFVPSVKVWVTHKGNRNEFHSQISDSTQSYICKT